MFSFIPKTLLAKCVMRFHKHFLTVYLIKWLMNSEINQMLITNGADILIILRNVEIVKESTNNITISEKIHKWIKSVIIKNMNFHNNNLH